MKKSIKLALLTCMSASLIACGKDEAITETSNSKNKPTKVESETADITNNALEKLDLSSFISGSFASSSLTEEYTQPMYNLDKDAEFVFNCTDELSSRTYALFGVYDNSKLSGASYADVEYFDGKLVVKPKETVHLTATGDGYQTTNDGTWGSLNELYLVQYYDLESGDELLKPLVTPFSIKHDLESPILKQSTDNKNNYMLSWQEVPGAVEYRIYERYGDDARFYELSAITSNTSIKLSEFSKQQEKDNLMDLFEYEMRESGLEVYNGEFILNDIVKYDDDLNNCRFCIVAVDSQGRQSGVSNTVDVRDIAHQLPYMVADTSTPLYISSVLDVPNYINVEMVDGSIRKMVIDYHGANALRYEQSDKMVVKAKVANTDFRPFNITFIGVDYDELLSQFSQVTAKQDEILASTGSGTKEPEVTIGTSTPETKKDDVEKEINNIPKSNDNEVDNTEDNEVDNTGDNEVGPATPVEPTKVDIGETPTETPENIDETPVETPENIDETPTDDMTTDGLPSPMEVFEGVAPEILGIIDYIGRDNITKVLFARNELQAWISLGLMSQSSIIPIPVEVYPDAANLDYVATLLVEAFRQNPTCGMIKELVYSPEYQAFILSFEETPEVRIEKTKEELTKAAQVASNIVSTENTEYGKVLAINEYLKSHGEYDYDSVEVQVPYSEAFIDAHTPYGILVKEYGVCESYSEAFALIARFAGLEAVCETGGLYGGPHEWNRVKIDGSWAIVDVTNNDIDIFENPLLNVTDSQISDILTPDKTAIMDNGEIAAIDITKEFYYVNNKISSNLEELKMKAVEQLSLQNIALIRVPATLTESDYAELFRYLRDDEGIALEDANMALNILYIKRK